MSVLQPNLKISSSLDYQDFFIIGVEKVLGSDNSKSLFYYP